MNNGEKAMAEQTGIGITRRNLLAATGMTIGVAVVDLGVSGAPASAAPAAVDLEVVGGDPVAVLSSDGSTTVTTVPRQLAVQVGSSSPLPAGTRLKVTYDRRIYALVEPPAVTLQGRLLPVTSETVSDADAAGQDVCTITLREAVPLSADGSTGLVAVVGTARQVSYPNDLVRRSVDASAELPATSRTAHARRSLRPTAAGRAGKGATPWGIALDGGWVRHSWGPDAEFSYYCPIQVTLRSVGPGAAPAQPGFTVSVDPRLVQELRVDAVRLNGKKVRTKVSRLRAFRDGAVYQTDWRVLDRLAAGDVLTVDLKPELIRPVGALLSIKHPVVSLSSLGDSPTRRDTGMNSLSRQDSVYA